MHAHTRNTRGRRLGDCCVFRRETKVPEGQRLALGEGVTTESWQLSRSLPTTVTITPPQPPPGQSQVRLQEDLLAWHGAHFSLSRTSESSPGPPSNSSPRLPQEGRGGTLGGSLWREEGKGAACQEWEAVFVWTE